MAGTDFGDAWLRVRVQDARRAGIADDVRAWLGERVVEVRVEHERDDVEALPDRRGRTPHELFDEYLAEEGIEDPRLGALFAELLEGETSG